MAYYPIEVEAIVTVRCSLPPEQHRLLRLDTIGQSTECQQRKSAQKITGNGSVPTTPASAILTYASAIADASHRATRTTNNQPLH